MCQLLTLLLFEARCSVHVSVLDLTEWAPRVSRPPTDLQTYILPIKGTRSALARFVFWLQFLQDRLKARLKLFFISKSQCIHFEKTEATVGMPYFRGLKAATVLISAAELVEGV